MHLVLSVRNAAADVIVVAQHGGVGEVFGVQIKVLFDHLGRDDHTRRIGSRVALAPRAHGAHVNALNSRVAVEFLTHDCQELFKASKEDGITVLGLNSARGHAIAARAFFVHVGGGGVVHACLALVGADAQGEGIAACSPQLHDLVQIGKVVNALLLFNVTPVKAQIEVVESGKIGKVVRRVSVLRMAVIRSAVAVVDIVPEPALVGVLEHRFIVHHAAQVNEIGARKGIVQHAAHGLRTVLCGCGAKIGVKLICHSNASFQTPRTCVRAMV